MRAARSCHLHGAARGTRVHTDGAAGECDARIDAAAKAVTFVAADNDDSTLREGHVTLCRGHQSVDRAGAQRPPICHAACDPRCAHPVVRFSIHENSSYIAIAITPIVTSPANASGVRCWLPAELMR